MLIVTFGDRNNSTLINSFNRNALKINISESKGKVGVGFNQTVVFCPWDISFTAQMNLVFCHRSKRFAHADCEKAQDDSFQNLFSFHKSLYCIVESGFLCAIT